MADPMPWSALQKHVDFGNELLRLMKIDKVIPLLDECKAFYSGIDEDESSTLCDICEALEFDDSSFGGTIYSCENTGRCQHLFFQDLDYYVSQDGRAKFMSQPIQFERKDSLPGLPSLTASAENGCQFCSLLISTLQNRGLTKISSIESTVSITNAQYEWNNNLDQKEKQNATDGRFVPDLSLRMFSLRVQVDNNQPFKLWFRISAPPILLAKWLRIHQRPPLEFPSHDDGQGRFTFKLWLDEHIKACTKCQIPTRLQCPRRLIDVGSASDEKDPRLIITEEHPEIFDLSEQEPPRYLALSYCWGDNPSKKHTTTNETLHKRCQRIPLEDFPAACRDAVIVTRTLGFQYLWIDAFCIIQSGERGDDKDWQEESRKLSATYGNAFLTIVPLSSQSSNEGFLPANCKSARIGFRSSLNENAIGSFWIHELPTDYQGYDGKDFQRRIQLSKATIYDFAREEIKRSKWRTRGWTFNEALMSRRMLYFGTKSVVFECHGLHYSERALEGPSIMGNDILQCYPWLQSMDKRGDSREIIGLYWTGSQSAISHRQFTAPTDRLPAISSFAELVSKTTGDEYIAGLFRSDLHRGLSWNKKTEDKLEGFEDHLDKSFFRHGKEFYKSRFRDGEKPSDCYVAPSWSWISTPSSSYPWHASSIATIIDAACDIKAKVQPENEDNPFGWVKSGHIVLTSKAYHSDSMRLYMQEEKLRLKDNAGFEADVDLDWALQLGPDEHLLISDCRWDENHPLWKSQGPLSGMHLVPLIQEEDGSETIGLIIIPFPNQTDESYMRAGIFKSKGTWNPSGNCLGKAFGFSNVIPYFFRTFLHHISVASM